jgi:signal transduction histidine kinase
LSAVLDAIRQVGRGERRPAGLPSHRHDEIGELAEGVAQMADRLRELEQERTQTERLRLIRQLSAGLAHELRNPLTAARMTLQLFMQRNQDRDDEPLRIALGELGRMERQVRRFLQIARPDPPRFEDAEIGPVLERSIAGLSATAEHQGVSLSLGEPGPLPLPPVRIDPEQVGQVVANLALNAIDAAGPGGRVRLAARRVGPDRVAIDVEDDGPGVPPGDEARLFQPFHTTKPEGVGLGLALCEALVREQGGTIAYAREQGWTRFRVMLPAGIVPAAPGPEMAAMTGSRGGEVG